MQHKIARFDFQDILPLALLFVVAGIGIAYGLDVLGDMGEDFCDGTLEHFNNGNCYRCFNSSWNYFNTTNSHCGNGTLVTIQHKAAPYAGDASVNATGDSITGISKLPEKIPLIINVIVAAIIIGILIRYLLVRYG